MENTLSCKVKFDRLMFPKDGSESSGGYQIATFKVVEGSVSSKLQPKTHKFYHTISAKGNMPLLKYDITYNFIGKEEKTDYGYQYIISRINEEFAFKNDNEKRLFLSQVLTESQFSNLYAIHSDPCTLLESENIEELAKAKGVGKTSAKGIINKFNIAYPNAKLYIRLHKYKLTDAMLNKLMSHYKSQETVIAKITENPYVLYTEIDGIGFKRADEVALNSGLDRHSEKRIRAFIKYYLTEQANNNGHSYVHRKQILTDLKSTLGDIPGETIKKVLVDMTLSTFSDKIKTNDAMTLFALDYNYQTEMKIAQHIKRLNDVKTSYSVSNWKKVIREMEELQDWELTDEQFNSVEQVINHNVILITGSAGTGKSTTVKSFHLTLKNNVNYDQCALSGRAGVNIQQATGVEGKTIHRLLGYSGEGFEHNSQYKLPSNVVVLDEFSMVNTSLFLSLIESIQTGSKLILLGDTAQLESIGVGNLMYDLIQSDVIKLCNFTKIHRQAEKSAIITESTKVRNYINIVDDKFEGEETRGELQDFTITTFNDNPFRPEGVNKPTIDLLIEKFNYLYHDKKENVMDICMILPTKTSGTSCYKLNNMIQKIVKDNLNKARTIELGTSQQPFNIYVGDKILNEQNNYNTITVEENEKVRCGVIGIKDANKTPVYNGNIGIVTSIKVKGKQKTVTVDFEGIGELVMTGEDINNISLGYAISFHKSQGSQFKNIIMGIDCSHYIMLNKELLYTGMTRAQKHCYLVGETKAIRMATQTSNIKKKQTFLQPLLTGKISFDPIIERKIEKEIILDESDLPF